MAQTPIRGELYSAALGRGEGSEQAGVRPVVVVSNDMFNEVMPVLTVAPLTTMRPGRRVHPSEVLVSKQSARLRADSLVLCHQVRTIAQSRLGRRIGSLDEAAMELISRALRLHLGL